MCVMAVVARLWLLLDMSLTLAIVGLTDVKA